MVQKGSGKLCSSFYPIYNLLKICGIFVPSFDTSYCLIVKLSHKIYAALVMLSVLGLFLWNFYSNINLFLNSTKIMDSALLATVIFGGSILLMTLIYQHVRSENIQQIYRIINQIDDKVK